MIPRTLALLMLLVLAPSLWAEEPVAARGEVEGFALEIPDATGQVRGILEGSKAVFDGRGGIRISDVLATIEREGSEVIVRSPEALYHRDAKIVTTDAQVEVHSRDIRIEGKGLLWEPDKEHILIRKSVHVVLRTEEQGE